MSHLDKGLPLYRTFSTLPKEAQTALNNVSTSVEGDDTVFQSARAYTYPVAASTTLPPPPSASSHQDWAASESHSSQQAYELHLHQFLHLNRASRPPPPSHSSRIFNEYNGYPKASGQAPCYQFNPGSRIAQDSQRTLVDTPRCSSVRSTGDSLSSKSSTDDPGGQEYKEQQNSRQRTPGGLGKHFTQLPSCLVANTLYLYDSQTLRQRKTIQGATTIIFALPSSNPRCTRYYPTAVHRYSSEAQNIRFEINQVYPKRPRSAPKALHPECTTSISPPTAVPPPC